jgi:chitinase
VLKNAPGTVYHHEPSGQSYKYDGNVFWSYDTPQDVARKVAFADSLGLGGVFAWEADGDAESEIVDAMAVINE